MKQFGKGFAVLMCLVLSTGIMRGQLSGTKTIGGGGDYATFTAAITDLNTNGVGSGGVTFRIASGTYTEAQIAMNIANYSPTAANPVVFKPANGATVVLNLAGQNTTNRYGLRIGDAGAGYGDYITLDGSNAVGGTSRDWTIIASDATYGLEPIDIWGDNVTVKNCIISCASGLGAVSTTSYGVTLRETAPTATNATIQNNHITSNYVIAVGRASGGDISGCTITGNELHGWKRGIAVVSASGIQILNNDVAGDINPVWNTTTYGIEYSSNASNTAVISGNIVHNWGSNSGTAAVANIYGINITGAGTYYIRNNKVHSIMNGSTFSSASNVSAVGIFMANASFPTYYVYNNMVYGMEDISSNAQPGFTAGIRTGSTATGTLFVYNNSVYMKHAAPRTHATAAYMFSSAAAPNQLNATCRNNISYVNVTGNSSTYKSFAIYKTANCLLTSDYNVLYNDGGANAVISTTGATMADWQGTGQDAHSLSISPAAPFGAAGQWTSETDLHWNGKPSNSFVATVLGAPYTTDIDGDSRDAAYPYMGADEIAGQPLPVEMNTFTVHALAKGAQIHWSTATETNCRGFEIERRTVISGAAGEWTLVGFVDGAGTSNAPRSYAFTDAVSLPGTYAYRIKQTDRDGGFAYYGNVEVAIGAAREFRIYGNYPNPFNPSTAIRFSVAQDGKSEMKIFNALGQEVATVFDQWTAAGTMHEVSFDASALPSGLYFARLKSNASVSVIKMMLMK